MRRRGMAILAALILTSAGVVAGAGPAFAVTEAAPGAPCDSADLGRRVGWPDTVVVTPEITHFKAYYVTAGSTGTQTVQLTYQQQLTVTVLSETTINVGFNFGVSFLSKVESTTHFAVTKVTMSTTIEQRTMVWNFTQPGYYAVYTGMHKVTGQMSALQCHRVQKADGTWATEWNRRTTGTYTSWGRDQEGAIRCEDMVPANTVMRLAQTYLGCDGAAAQKAARAPADASAPASSSASSATKDPVSTNAVPSGYACEAGYYRIVSDNGLKMDADDDHDGEYVGWTTGSGDSPQWRLCNGPADASGMQPSVLVNKGYGKCLGVTPNATATEGARIDWRTCEAVPARQKLYIYRDVPGSDRIGIQVAYRGAMVGQDELINGAVIRQYQAGLPDGSGTFHLVPA